MTNNDDTRVNVVETQMLQLYLGIRRFDGVTKRTVRKVVGVATVKGRPFEKRSGWVGRVMRRDKCLSNTPSIGTGVEVARSRGKPKFRMAG